MIAARRNCRGCGWPKAPEELKAFRPDGLGDIFELCRGCVRGIRAGDPAIKAMEKIRALHTERRLKLGLCGTPLQAALTAILEVYDQENENAL